MLLSNYLEGRFGKGARLETLRVFSQLGLPMPVTDEFSVTHDRGILLFINPAACVLRLQKKTTAEKRVPSAALLQPLGIFEGSQILAELYPGVRSALKLEVDKPHCHSLRQINAAKNRQLRDIVREEGNCYWDLFSRNLIYLPDAYGGESFDHPLIVDMDAIEKNKKETWQPPEQQRPARKKSYQEKLYKPLRDAFQAAQSNGTSFQPFWDQCIKAQETGLLVRSWDDLGVREAGNTSIQYEQRLKWRRCANPFYN